jgi:hypothetical protein
VATGTVTVAVKRNVRVDDLAGGVTSSWQTVIGLEATVVRKRRYSRESWKQLVRAQSKAEVGPGYATSESMLFIWPTATPAVPILHEDNIVETTGETWEVIEVRSYEGSLQIDTNRTVEEHDGE